MNKGLVFDIRRYSVHDGPGIRTTVFLKGCPLRCPWCHNPEGIGTGPQAITRHRKLNGQTRNYKETVGRWVTPAEVFELIEKDRIFYEESGGGVTFSGGEPLMQPVFLQEMISLCSQAGIQTAVDTSGHAGPREFKTAVGHADLLLYDLKSADPREHARWTGRGNDLIVKNLKSLDGSPPRLIIRIPVIPGFNSDPKQMEAIRDLLVLLKAPVQRIDLLPYHRLGRQKYRDLGMRNGIKIKGEISGEEINRLMDIFSGSGFKVKKGG